MKKLTGKEIILIMVAVLMLFCMVSSITNSEYLAINGFSNNKPTSIMGVEEGFANNKTLKRLMANKLSKGVGGSKLEKFDKSRKMSYREKFKEIYPDAKAAADEREMKIERMRNTMSKEEFYDALQKEQLDDVKSYDVGSIKNRFAEYMDKFDMKGFNRPSKNARQAWNKFGILKEQFWDIFQ